MKITNAQLGSDDLIPFLVELSNVKSLPVTFSWDFSLLLGEILKLSNTFSESKDVLIRSNGTFSQKIDNYQILESDENYPKFIRDYQILLTIETELTSKKPTLNKKEVVDRGCDIPPMVLAKLCDFINLED